MVTFKIDTKEFKSTLKKMQVAFPGRSRAVRKAAFCEITLKSNKLELIVPGILYTIPAITSGTAKIVVPFFHLITLVNSYNNDFLEFSIVPGELNIDNFSLGVKTTFFEDDSILRSIHLPMNYSDVDILRLLAKGYTQEELDFNRISPAIDKARKSLISNIKAAMKILQPYGVTQEDLKELVTRRLGVDLLIEE